MWTIVTLLETLFRVVVAVNKTGDGEFPKFLETHINPDFSKGVKL